MDKLENTMSWEEVHDHLFLKIGRKINKADRPIFKKWFMEREFLGLSFDAIMVLRCFRIWQEIEKGLDHFVVISGREGYGKSTLSFQIAAWINPKGFGLKNICYSAKEYLSVLSKKSEEYSKQGYKKHSESLVMDEGTELLSRESLSITNRSLAKSFFIQRALNFLVIVNIPNFHMLDGVIRNHRCRTLIELTNRGKYKGITKKGIPIVAKEGLLTKSVLGVKIPYGTFWEGGFRIDFPPMINRKEYEDHKLESIKTALETMQDDIVQQKLLPASKVVGEIVGMDRKTLIRLIKKGEVDGKQIGAKWYITKKAYDKLIVT